MPLTERRRAAARAIAGATAVAALLLVARRFDPLPNGLRAQYFANLDWQGAAAVTVADDLPSTRALAAAAGGVVATGFSASWSGWIIAPRDDAYTFATTSDDGSWVYVDNAPVVENGGVHEAATRTGPTIRLTRGPHSVFIRYFQDTGKEELTWLWQRGAGSFDPVPAWALRPHRIEYSRFRMDRALETAAAAAPWLWAAAVLTALFIGFRPEVGESASRARGTVGALRREGVWRALLWVVALSAALDATAVWWGLPHGPWMGDELIPSIILGAIDTSFVHGWHDKYPPLQFYLLGLAYVPVMAAQALVSISPGTAETLFFLSGRLLSVAMGTVAVAATFFCGRRAFGARAGLWAAAVLALVAPFSYYAKAANVDVPYVMWFALCLACYLRVLAGGTAADYAAWAAFGTLAVCTKDQAYGLMVGMPLVVVFEQARTNRSNGQSRPWLRSIVDRRIRVAAITAIVLFFACHNVLFNPTGLPSHIEMILESESYRMFPRTLGGRLMVQLLSLRLIARSFGWPMAATIAAGVIAALTSRWSRRAAVHLLAPAISYQLTFINVVVFAYDRFLLPVCLVLSVFGGYAIDRFLRSAAAEWWRRGLVAAIVAYTLLYSGAVDALMLTDSRHQAEAWLDAHVKDDDQIAMSSVATYMPRLWKYAATEVYDRESFDTIRPTYYVLNVDYTTTEPPDSPLGQIIADVKRGGGYRLAFRTEDTRPLRWLPFAHPDLAGDRREMIMGSFLRNLSPQIEIYQRVGAE